MTTQRKTGYYWCRLINDSQWRVSKYDQSIDSWFVCGNGITFTNDEFIFDGDGNVDIEVDEEAIVRREVKE